jgi:hypothetical protein
MDFNVLLEKVKKEAKLRRFDQVPRGLTKAGCTALHRRSTNALIIFSMRNNSHSHSHPPPPPQIKQKETNKMPQLSMNVTFSHVYKILLNIILTTLPQ